MRDILSSKAHSIAYLDGFLILLLFRDYLEVEISPPNERVHQVVDVLLKHVNAVVTKLRSVFLVEDIVDSLKVVQRREPVVCESTV